MDSPRRLGVILATYRDEDDIEISQIMSPDEAGQRLKSMTPHARFRTAIIRVSTVVAFDTIVAEVTKAMERSSEAIDAEYWKIIGENN